jgi:cytochrome c biogenesis protein CcmG/thiol:disulfide interchange protein DsbE
VAPWIVLVVTLAIGGLFVVLAGSDPQVNKETADTPLLGKAAPLISGPTADGSTFDLGRMRGTWVVLNFFQSTCVPCQNEHPELVAFAASQADRPDGAQLVSVVWNDSRRDVVAFFAERGGDWPVVLDDVGRYGFEYGVTQVPETWIVDPAGRVVVHYIGEITSVGLQAKLQELRDLGTGSGG